MKIKPYDRHMIHFKSIVIVCVLIRVCSLEIMILVYGRDNIQMVMGSIRMWYTLHIVYFLVAIQLGQNSFRVLFFYCTNVRDVPKVQFMNDVTDIQSSDLLVNDQSCKYVLIGMTTDVKITRDLLYSERSCQSAAILVSESISSHLELPHLIRLSQQFKIRTVDSLTV